MTGQTGYKADCASTYQHLKKKDLNPLDLYNWDVLTLIEKLTRLGRRVGERRENVREFRAFRIALFEALQRKAEDVEATTGDSSNVDWLKELIKEEIRTTR